MGGDRIVQPLFADSAEYGPAAGFVILSRHDKKDVKSRRSSEGDD